MRISSNPLAIMAVCSVLTLAILSPALAQVSATGAASMPSDQPAKAAPQGQKTINIWQAAVLGVVEGLTEYLPVSSTGHLILASHWMGLSEFSSETGPLGRKLIKAPAIDAFEIVIQLGAILAVVGLYRGRVGQMALGVVGRNSQGLRLFMMLVIAFLPAMIMGLLLHKQIEEHLFSPTTVAWALAIGGLLMMGVQRVWRQHWCNRPRTQLMDIAMWQALVIGLAQVLAMWPGTSRSMITIVAALAVGLDMVAAAEFSFLLALPTLGGATLYSALKSGDEMLSSAGPVGLLVGIVVSGIVAAIAVKGLVKWLTHHGLAPFGVYRILLAIVVYIALMS